MLLCLPLLGCGQYLGDYSLENVEAVRGLPASFPKDAQSYGEFLAITLASSTNLAALSEKRQAVYVNADFCPMQNGDGIVALGPVNEAGKDPTFASNAIGIKPHGDGRFRYRIYLVPAHPMPDVHYSTSAMEWPRYDLRSARRDVCVRLHAPGYNVTRSQSQTVIVPAELIVAALSQSDRTKNGR
ncbi:MAG TPA: hypothetical protein VFH89_09015 [Sphingomicrobium sp.]|nr:hypothetical protein [Sphingomicrobium sp.]